MTLFLHGFTGAPQSGDRLLGALGNASGWEAPWLLGHGRAPNLTRSATFEEEAQYLLAHTTSRVCVGYSLGSRLALAMALLAPERFDRLILIGVSPGLKTQDERETRKREDEVRATELERDGLVAFIDAWQALPLFDEDTLPADVRAERRAIRLAHRATGLAAALRILGLGQMPSYTEQLQGLRNTHIVVGERDTKFRSIAGDIAARSDAKVHVVPNAGHDALLWAPSLIARIAA
ncbi:MAG: alpha/beta fold hydrolase [Polyangiales bacterium]